VLFIFPSQAGFKMIFNRNISLLLAYPCLSSAFVIPTNHATSRNLYASEVVEIQAPERIAPNAGYIPEWEDREGLPVSEFMQSDMKKPDLSEMWECPLTRWDSNE